MLACSILNHIHMKLIYSLLAFSLLSFSSCKKCKDCCEPSISYDPANPDSYASCKAPEVAQNIIGSWKFEAHGMDSANITRSGYITFDALNRISDPDSLLQNRLNFETNNPGVPPTSFYRPVISKNYKTAGKRVEFELYYLHPRLGKTYGQGWTFEVVENQCNRIKMIPPDNLNKHRSVVLTR